MNNRQPALELPSELVRLLREPSRLAKLDDVLEHLAQSAWILLDDTRFAWQMCRDLEHVLIGHGAHVADSLGDDQIWG